MSSEEVKISRSKSRRKNIIAKQLFDPGDHRGAFRMKVIDHQYKRKKMKIYDVKDTEEGDDNDY